MSKEAIKQNKTKQNGMGSYFFRKKYRFIASKKWSELTNGGNYRRDMNWRIHFDGDAFGGVDEQTDQIEYIEQLFDHDPGSDLSIRKGDQLAAIGSFVVDSWKEFTPAGISRINDSIRTIVWAILGSQTQTRSSILGSGKAFDAQKQFLANVEDAINSEVDLPSSIDRYQRTLLYARSKLDYAVGYGLYLLPSDMNLLVGTVYAYNNLIQIASDDMSLGYNAEVNEGVELRQNEELAQTDDSSPQPEPQNVELVEDDKLSSQSVRDIPLSHDEKKLSLILSAAVIGLVVTYFR